MDNMFKPKSLSIGKMPWLKPLVRYMIFIAIASLVWEFAQMPLYTLWNMGTTAEIAFAAMHCTGGDILIALLAIVSAIVLIGKFRWPLERRFPVLVFTVLLGFAYTWFSEWFNIEVRGSWAYGDMMPIVPVINMGFSPFLQWTILPIIAFLWTLRGQGAAGGQEKL